MSQASPHFAVDTPRLVRCIAELGLGPAGVSREHFAQRLGQFFDLQDSIAIAAVHGGLSRPQPVAHASQDVTRLFLDGRGAILQSALNSFEPDGVARIRFPLPDPGEPPAASMEAQPYLAFYAAQQSDAEHRVRRLQTRIREAVAARSQSLQQLCALDAVLGKSMVARSRAAFAALPQLLQNRFEQLLAGYRPTGGDETEDRRQWLAIVQRYRSDMRNLLLAEIDTRLLPVTGLVEAFEAHQREGNHD